MEYHQQPLTLDKTTLKFHRGKDEREDIQKKTFTKWINSQLSKAGRAAITDLSTGLKDGTSLLSLLEVLSGLVLKREKGRLRVHHINNVNTVLHVLESNYNIKLVNISSNDIVDGNPKLTLGLVWSIILHWQVKDVMRDVAGDLRPTNLERTLLTWCQTNTEGYQGVLITNFTTSWKDGLAFNALLHHFRPDLFRYESQLTKDSESRLNHAFQLAEDRLGIARLLDAEDVMVDTPDKKSIMTYLMCMFQVLPHTTTTTTPSTTTSTSTTTNPSSSSPHIPLEPPTPLPLTKSPTPRPPRPRGASPPGSPLASGSERSLSSSSELAALVTSTTAASVKMMESGASVSSESAPSMASSGSVELQSYQDSLENVLTWLLEAEDVMDKQTPLSTAVHTVKGQFNTHEEFMLELTQHQDSIGAVLRDGNELITEGRVTEEEEHEIHVQMGLLNNRWEELRFKALDRQARLQQVLMELQQQQLEELGSWLTWMEERISNQEPVGTDLEAIKKQVDDHKVIQQSLEDQQKRVDSLQHMVVVVDDSTADGGAACQAMEKQLEQLGARWAAVCRWTEDQWVVLQEVLLRWQQFNDEQTKFTLWLADKETVLTRMAQTDLSDPDQVIAQVKNLKTDLSDPNQVIVQVKNLKAIENDMGEQVRRFDALNECGQQIVRYVDSQAAVSRIAALLETLQERWEKLVQLMEIHSNQIASSGVELSKISQLYEAAAASEEDERPGVEEAKVEKHEAAKASSSTSVQSSKKRKVESVQRVEFEVQLKLLKDWISSTEASLGLLVMPHSQEPFTMEEQRVLLQDTENSLRSHQIDVQKVITLGRGVITELKIAGEGHESVAASIQDVEERWEQLKKKLADTQHLVNQNFETKKFSQELTALQELLTGYEKWVGSTEHVATEAQEITKQLDQCKVKLRAMQTHQERVDRLKVHGEQTVRQFKSPGSVKEDLQSFLTRWQHAFNRIRDRQTLLREEAEKAPPRSYLEAMAVLLKWLSDIEAILQGKRVHLGSVTTLHTKLDMYKELKRDIDDHAPNRDYIKQTGQELIKRCAAEQAKALEADLSSLHSRWIALTTTIEQRHARLEKAVSQLKEYQTQYEGLNKWMDEMDIFLHTEDPALGDIPALEAQLQESMGVQEDIKTLQLNVKSINSIAKIFMDDSDHEFKTHLQEEVGSLNKRWEGVVTLSRHQNKRLQGQLGLSQGVSDQMDALTQWLVALKQDLANKDYSVDSPSDLLVKCKKFRSLKKEVSEREEEVNKVNEEVNSMLSGAPSGSLQEMARALMMLTSLWGDVCQRVDRYTNLYDTSDHQWKEFKELVERERRNLQTLEHKVRRPSTTSSDAEDISEELNEMETILQEHEEEKERVQELAGELMANCIMPQLVQQERDDFVTKWDALQIETKSKISRLELFIQRAQTIERQMLEMSQWMSEMGQHLQSRLEADLLAGDVPQEYENLKEEFHQQESLLKELEEQVTQYRQEGKMEASARLEQQTQLLRKHYAEVTVKFRKFQRPPDFEPKLNLVKRELEGIQGTIHLLEVPSDDPAAIQERHGTCMKYYKTMSDLKPEVEYVIKTGRQVVERKQVDFPDKLNKQLDAIKQLYNDMGAQVTQNKTNLDKGLKLSRRLHKEMTQLNDFIAESNAELSKRQTLHSHSVDDELAFVKKVQEEMQNREVSVKMVHELIQQIATLAEDADLSQSRQQVYDINQSWTELSLRLTKLKGALQEENSTLQAQFINFQSQILKVKDWLGRTENILASHSRLSESQQATSPHTDTVKQTLLLQMNEMKSQVDEVRDLAVTLMARSHPFTPMVEPELTHLNQRWEEVAALLKTKQTPQQDMITAVEVPKVATSPVTTKASSPGPESPGRPKTEGEGEFTMAYKTLQAHVQSFEENFATQGKLMERDFSDNIEGDIQLMDEETKQLESEVTEVMEQGEALLQAAENCRDPVTHARTSSCLQELKGQWSGLQSDVEAKREALIDIAPQWYEFSRCNQDLEQWFESMEKQLSKGDIQDIEAFEDEVRRRSHDLDTLQTSSALAITDRGAAPMVERPLHALNQRWEDLSTRLAAFKASLPSSLTPTLTPTFTPLPDVTNHVTKTSSFSSYSFQNAVSPITSHSGGEEGEEVLRLLGQVGLLQQRLRSPELSSEDFTQLDVQNAQLKAIEGEIVALHPAVREAEERQRERGPLVSLSEDHRRLQELTSQLTTQWGTLNTAHGDRHQRWKEAQEQWTRYRNDLQELSVWLDSAENQLTKAEGAQDHTAAHDIWTGLESGIRVQQGTVNSMNSGGQEILRQTAPPQAEALRQRQEEINQRWKLLCSEVFNRQNYSGSGVDEASVRTSDFTEDMDELFFWIDETENMLGSTLKMEANYLTELLEKVKDRAEDVGPRQESLKAVQASGHRMVHRDSLTTEDRDNIHRDLNNLHSRWTKVTADLPKCVERIEQKLKQLRALQGEANEVQAWLETTKELLETQVSPHNSPNSHAESDAAVVDPQTIQFALQTRQVKISRINTNFRRLSESGDDEAERVEMPEKLSEQVAAINRDWAAVQQLADHITHDDSDEDDEVMEPVSVELQHSAYTLTQSSLLSSPPLTTAATTIITTTTTTSSSASSSVSGHVERGQPPWREFNSLVTELQEWLGLLEDLLLSQKVTVCRSQEVEQVLQTHQSLLQDMENRHGQMEDVRRTASAIQHTTDSETDKLAVSEQVAKLQHQWDTARRKAERRREELSRMLQECRSFHQSYADLETWLAGVEADLDSTPVRPESPQLVQTLLKHHENLQEEVSSRQQTVDQLKAQAEKLIDDYSHDDTSNTRTQLERLNNRWSCLLNRLGSQWKALQNDQNSLQQYQVALEDFLGRLEAMRGSWTHLASETAKPHVQPNTDLSKAYLEQFHTR
ncbi:hypothetical protein ACOMHN_039855 [Nucella lapillus]